MEHIGIDLGASRSAVCVVSSEGAVLLERTIQTSEIERLGIRSVALPALGS